MLLRVREKTHRSSSSTSQVRKLLPAVLGLNIRMIMTGVKVYRRNVPDRYVHELLVAVVARKVVMASWKKTWKVLMDSNWVTTFLDWIPHLGSQRGLVTNRVLWLFMGSRFERQGVFLLVRGATRAQVMVVWDSGIHAFTNIVVGASEDIIIDTVSSCLDMRDMAVDVILSKGALRLGGHRALRGLGLVLCGHLGLDLLAIGCCWPCLFDALIQRSVM